VVGITCDYPLISSNTNAKSGFIEVIYIGSLDPVLLANKLILLKPRADIVRLVGVLTVDIDSTLFPNIVFWVPSEQSSSPLLTNNRCST